MKKYSVLSAITLLIIASLACHTLTGDTSGDVSPNGGGGSDSDQGVDTWYDEDGHAVVGDGETPRFYNWLPEFIKSHDPKATIQDNGTWFQAILSNGLVVSAAEWGEEQLTLGYVDGLYEGKGLFVAMRDFDEWVNSPSVIHYTCSGTYIPSYSATMASFDVHMSTIIQFDGSAEQAQAFVNALASSWSTIRLNLNGCPTN